jgi:hypothetical protein
VTRYGLGELQARAGRPADAGRCFAGSLDRFDRLGAAHWRSRALLARAPPPGASLRPAPGRRDRPPAVPAAPPPGR